MLLHHEYTSLAKNICFFLFLLAILQNSGNSNSVDPCLLNRIDLFPCTITVNLSRISLPGPNQFGVYSSRIRGANVSSLHCVLRSRHHQVLDIPTLPGDERIKFLYSPGRQLQPPQNYNNQQLVQYNISCPSGHMAFFNMTYIELEEPNCYDRSTNQSVCVDYVRVSRLPSGCFTEVCGNEYPDSNFCQDHTETGEMEVLFRTSDSGRFPGFQATIICYEEEDISGCVSSSTNPKTSRKKRNVKISFSTQEKEAFKILTTAQSIFVTEDSSTQSTNGTGTIQDSAIVVAILNENSCNPVLRTSAQATINFIEREHPERLAQLRANISSTVNCGPLSDPTNGKVTLTDTMFGSRAIYTCDPGYAIVGDNTRICEINGRWSGSIFCQVDCGGLSSPVNGQARLTETLLGSVATYTCNSGYVVVGNDTRECLPDGSWSEEEPKCVLTNLAAVIGAVMSAIVILLLIGLVLVVCCLIYYWKKRRHLKTPTCSPKTSKFSNKSSKGIKTQSRTSNTQHQEILIEKMLPQSLRIPKSQLEFSGAVTGEEYDTMKVYDEPNIGRSSSAEDFYDYDTTTAPTLNKNIAYNAHKKAVLSTYDNQVSSNVSESTARPTEYDYIPTLSSRVSRPEQSSTRAFDNSISTIDTKENVAYKVHRTVQ